MKEEESSLVVTSLGGEGLATLSDSASSEEDEDEERVNSDKFFVSTSSSSPRSMDFLNWFNSILNRIRVMSNAHVIVPMTPRKYFTVSFTGESKATAIVRT